jgi:NAD(P)-dependent dehydrogenase (short-subunit alcohol dehydrogenase family)
VLNYVSPESQARAEKIATELETLHSTRTIVVKADQATVDGPARLVEEATKAFGDRIDIIINNAGTCVCLSLEDSTAKQFDSHYYLNVRGPMLLVQAAIPYLPHDGSGRIVNISSISSSIGFPMQSPSAHSLNIQRYFLLVARALTHL